MLWFFLVPLLRPCAGRFAQRHVSAMLGREGLVDNPVNHVLEILDRKQREETHRPGHDGAFAAVKTVRPRAAEARYFENALLDHFGSVTKKPGKWRQRYYVDDTVWAPGGPIFLYVGGEGPQGPPSSNLFMWNQAEKYGALMVALEHRFYGESRPVKDMTNEHLKFLSSAQALADVARFIDYFKDEYKVQYQAFTAKWITFGGSYPGALSAWFKLKYPSKVSGAIASSAPVFAVFDFYQYAEVTGFALQDPLIGGSPECTELLTYGVRDLVSIIDRGLLDNIPDPLKPCDDGADILNDELDRATYYSNIYGNFQGVVQYNLEGSTPVVEDVCLEVTKQYPDSLGALAAASALFFTSEGCVPSSFRKDYVDGLTKTEFSEAGCDLSCKSDRQWIYQSCNEFGYFQTTAIADSKYSPFDPFGQTLTIDTAGVAICEAAFNITGYTTPRADAVDLAANAFYGARHFDSDNVTFVNGDADPWHSLSIVNSSDPFYQAGGNLQSTASPEVDIVELHGTAHCRDMYAPGAFERFGIPDTADVQWAHAKIADDILRYLS